MLGGVCALLSFQVPEYQPIPIGVGPGETPFSQLAVSTTDTVRMSYIMNKLVRKGKFMMLVGTAGTGKTSIVKEYLRRYGHAIEHISVRVGTGGLETSGWFLLVLHATAKAVVVVPIVQKRQQPLPVLSRTLAVWTRMPTDC